MSNLKELNTATICREDLRITIRNNLDRVAQFMQVEDIITRETWREATDTKISADNRAKDLLKKWEEKVEEDPRFFTKVVEGHFRQSPEHYKSILSKLDEEYRRQGGSPAFRQWKLDEPVAKVHQSGSTTASSAAVAPSPNSGSKVDEMQLSSHHLTLIKWQDSHGDVEELRLYDEMAPDWTTVADLVGISTGSIKKNCREVEDCIKTAMKRWIDDAPNLTNYKCTWNGLCTLLSDMQKGAVHKRLKQAIAADVSTLKKNFSADSASTSQSSNISAEVHDTAAIQGTTAATTPAKASGTKKLSPYELYDWLLEQSVDEEDATKLKDKGVSERAFMMISKKNPQFYNILKEGTQCILECLQEDLKNRK